MFGFPIGNGNSGFNDFVEKFTNNADSGFPNIQQREVFYSIKDGNWNDITIWQTASGRVGILPTINDDVYIRNSITYTSVAAISVYNLFITGIFNFGTTGGLMSVYGNIKCTGTFNQLTGSLSLYGSDNYINNYTFTNGSEASINYSRNDGIPQPIMPLTYWYINMNGISQKYLTVDLVTTGTSVSIYNSINSPFDTRGYNITYNSPISFNSPNGDFISNGSILVFRGAVTWINIRRYDIINSTIEFQNGWIWNNPIGTFANSVINFTTNTQNIVVNYSGAGAHIIDANSVNIVGNITLNIAAAGNDYLVLNCPINGTTASSQLTNRSLLQFGNAASVPSMTTGVFDFTTFANTINYGGNYSATIPSYFTTFHNLTISGTGTKTLGVNTTLNGNLSIPATGGIVLECSAFDLIVNGTTTLSGNGSILSKNSSGNILFVGLLSTTIGNANFAFTGNPNVELRGGISISTTTALSLGSGGGTWSFTTNNQTFTSAGVLGGSASPGTPNVTFNSNILVSGAITLTLVNNLNLNGTINGNNASSTWDNRGILYLYNSTLPMLSNGVFIFNVTSTSVIGYMFNGNYNLPYTSYKGLVIGGTGTKTLLSNTTVDGNLYCNGTNLVGGSGYLECSIYNLTVNGTTVVQTAGTLSKNSGGNILFVGALNITTIGSAFATLSLTGNPNVEFKGGNSLNTNGSTINSGTGTWSFTTNNQTFQNPTNTTHTFNCSILISGAITLTYTGTTHIFKGLINGDNASSQLLIGTGTPSLNYQNATQPMTTGILDTSTNLNTWIYGLNNQDIKGNIVILTKQVYRNLTLNGTGVKTLQGYCSVLNTYTLTSPATLNLNGYTLTNP